MHSSKMQPLYTHVNKLITSDVQICLLAPYLNLHAKYSHMPNMPRGLTTGALSSVFISPLSPQNQNLRMSLRSDNMRFSVLWFRSDIRIELQAPVA